MMLIPLRVKQKLQGKGCVSVLAKYLLPEDGFYLHQTQRGLDIWCGGS